MTQSTRIAAFDHLTRALILLTSAATLSAWSIAMAVVMAAVAMVLFVAGCF